MAGSGELVPVTSKDGSGYRLVPRDEAITQFDAGLIVPVLPGEEAAAKERSDAIARSAAARKAEIPALAAAASSFGNAMFLGAPHAAMRALGQGDVLDEINRERPVATALGGVAGDVVGLAGGPAALLSKGVAKLAGGAGTKALVAGLASDSTALGVSGSLQEYARTGKSDEIAANAIKGAAVNALLGGGVVLALTGVSRIAGALPRHLRSDMIDDVAKRLESAESKARSLEEQAAEMRNRIGEQRARYEALTTDTQTIGGKAVSLVEAEQAAAGRLGAAYDAAAASDNASSLVLHSDQLDAVNAYRSLKRKNFANAQSLAKDAGKLDELAEVRALGMPAAEEQAAVAQMLLGRSIDELEALSATATKLDDLKAASKIAERYREAGAAQASLGDMREVARAAKRKGKFDRALREAIEDGRKLSHDEAFAIATGKSLGEIEAAERVYLSRLRLVEARKDLGALSDRAARRAGAAAKAGDDLAASESKLAGALDEIERTRAAAGAAAKEIPSLGTAGLAIEEAAKIARAEADRLADSLLRDVLQKAKGQLSSEGSRIIGASLGFGAGPIGAAVGALIGPAVGKRIAGAIDAAAGKALTSGIGERSARGVASATRAATVGALEIDNALSASEVTSIARQAHEANPDEIVRRVARVDPSSQAAELAQRWASTLRYLQSELPKPRVDSDRVLSGGRLLAARRAISAAIDQRALADRVRAGKATREDMRAIAAIEPETRIAIDRVIESVRRIAHTSGKGLTREEVARLERLSPGSTQTSSGGARAATLQQIYSGKGDGPGRPPSRPLQLSRNESTTLSRALSGR